MAITDEDRARIGELAMRAVDHVVEHFGEEATLEDAVLLYEVRVVGQFEPKLKFLVRAGGVSGPHTL